MLPLSYKVKGNWNPYFCKWSFIVMWMPLSVKNCHQSIPFLFSSPDSSHSSAHAPPPRPPLPASERYHGHFDVGRGKAASASSVSASASAGSNFLSVQDQESEDLFRMIPTPSQGPIMVREPTNENGGEFQERMKWNT